MLNEKINSGDGKTKAQVRSIGIYLINGILVTLIIRRVIVIDNDKAIFVFLFYYPIVFIADMIISGVSRRFSLEASDIFMDVAICLMILYLPIAYLLSEY
jgi:hypothetical protein